MTNLQTIIYLLRESDRPQTHAKLMDDAADILSKIYRMQKPINLLIGFAQSASEIEGEHLETEYAALKEWAAQLVKLADNAGKAWDDL